ncbi:MAG: Winged helix DNA-binding domain, partial [Actinomycetia bacterium]|nr:Winged helix DNA-binding domain [Actinomycetes bacterium]
MATASGAGDRLDRRALNRATLARQLLLGRVELPVAETVARLGGLNAQDVEPPYLTLWARLAGFERDALTRALEDRAVVRGTLLRGTQHLVTADDYLAWRPLLQPVMAQPGPVPAPVRQPAAGPRRPHPGDDRRGPPAGL